MWLVLDFAGLFSSFLIMLEIIITLSKNRNNYNNKFSYHVVG